MSYYRRKIGRGDVVPCLGVVREDEHIEPVVVMRRDNWDIIKGTILSFDRDELMDSLGDELTAQLLKAIAAVHE